MCEDHVLGRMVNVEPEEEGSTRVRVLFPRRDSPNAMDDEEVEVVEVVEEMQPQQAPDEVDEMPDGEEDYDEDDEESSGASEYDSEEEAVPQRKMVFGYNQFPSLPNPYYPTEELVQHWRNHGVDIEVNVPPPGCTFHYADVPTFMQLFGPVQLQVPCVEPR